jgi:hypothetical protein
LESSLAHQLRKGDNGTTVPGDERIGVRFISEREGPGGASIIGKLLGVLHFVHPHRVMVAARLCSMNHAVSEAIASAVG